MGRKKKTQDKFKAAEAKKTARCRDDILDVLLSLYEIGSGPPSVQSDREETALRGRMIVHLDRWSNAMAQFTRFDKASRNGDDPFKNDMSNVQVPNDYGLLQLEEASLNVRSTCHNYVEMLECERDEIFHINRQLENLCRTHAAVLYKDSMRGGEVSILVRTLASQYLRQLVLEEQVIGEIRDLLSRIYDGEMEGTVQGDRQKDDRIRKWSQLLSERTLLDRLHWNSIPLLIDKLEKVSVGQMTESRLYNPSPDILPTEESPADDKLHRCLDRKTQILAADTIGEALEAFLSNTVESQYPKYSDSTFLLLIGSQGCGKTHLCDQIEGMVSDANASTPGSACVIRPTLPLDLMGRYVGETEDILVSLFGSHENSTMKRIVILDGVEHVLGDEFGDSTRSEDSVVLAGEERHVTVRARSTFFAILDCLREKRSGQDRLSTLGNDTLVVCTTCRCSDDMIGRFDKLFVIPPPSCEARRAMISSSLGIPAVKLGETSSSSLQVENLLSHVAEKTIGRSNAEIAQCCREASRLVSNSIVDFTSVENEAAYHLSVLGAMNEALKSIAPESLRGGVISESVDMLVYSARDLLADEEVPVQLSLFGDSALEAWRQIDRLIVTPLCRSDAFDDIMDRGRQASRGTVCAGVLLTGPSGCGKSALAQHCAKVAASVLDSVTLMDISCTSLVHKEVGASERAVQRIFAAARSAAPCILLMDGIENVAAVRGHDNTSEGTMDRILSTLLTELDGVDDDLARDMSYSMPHPRIAVIGITQEESWVDPALRRPGRLEKTIRLQHPDYEARRRIVLKHIENVPSVSLRVPGSECFEPDTYGDLASFVASSCQSATAADVIALCREASLISARNRIQHGVPERGATIGVEDFNSALEVREMASASKPTLRDDGPGLPTM